MPKFFFGGGGREHWLRARVTLCTLVKGESQVPPPLVLILNNNDNNKTNSKSNKFAKSETCLEKMSVSTRHENTE